MIFKHFKVYDSEGKETFNVEFDEEHNLIFSKENSKGKTSVVKLLLKTMGFNSNLTAGIENEKYKTKLCILIENENLQLSYNNRTKEISYFVNDRYVQSFDSKNNDDRIILLSNIFIGRNEFLSEAYIRNILGCFYIDQDTGWTLINKGNSIGYPRNGEKFNIVTIVEELSEVNNVELDMKIDSLDKSISKYKNILKVLEDTIDTMDSIEKNESSDKEVELKDINIKIRKIDNEIITLKKSIKDNNSAINYILNYGLSVKILESEDVVYLDNEAFEKGDFEFNNLEIIQEISKSRISELKLNKKRLENEKTRILNFFNNEGLIPVEKMTEHVAQNLSNLSVNIESTQKVIDIEMSERKKLNEERTKKSEKSLIYKKNSDLYSKDFIGILEYLKVSSIDLKKFKKNIYSKKVKGLSGSSRARIALATRLSISKLIYDSIKVKIPLIIDSPFSEEYDENVEKLVIGAIDKYSVGQTIIFSIEADKVLSLMKKEPYCKEIKEGVLGTIDKETNEDSNVSSS